MRPVITRRAAADMVAEDTNPVSSAPVEAAPPPVADSNPYFRSVADRDIVFNNKTFMFKAGVKRQLPSYAIQYALAMGIEQMK